MRCDEDLIRFTAAEIGEGDRRDIYNNRGKSMTNSFMKNKLWNYRKNAKDYIVTEIL